MIKLITIDLDGTLFDKKKNISIENIETIKKARKLGVNVVIATGRPLEGVKTVASSLGMDGKDDYLICYNGAMIVNLKTMKSIKNTFITGFDVKEIYRFARDNNLNFHAFYDSGRLITSKKNEYTDVETRINNITEYICDINECLDEAMFLKAMIVDDPKKLDEVIKKIPKHFYDKYNIVRSAGIFLEFLNKSIDKGYALMTIADRLNIPLSETMAIGDATNDLHMIKVAKVGVAMANSFPEVIKEADYITSSNEESGVAKAIQKFVLDVLIK